MDLDEEKIKKLVLVSTMYYEDNMTQSEISKIMHLSRPLISKYLSMAKELGFVEIRIRSPFESDNHIMSILKERYKIKGGGLISPASKISVTESLIIKSAFQFVMETLETHKNIGISWGNMIGGVVELLNARPGVMGMSGQVSSLLGNSTTANKNYHTDELCRIFSQKTGLTPNYVHAPALLESQEELNFYTKLEIFKRINQQWKNLDFAIINIENHPSVPDLATASRFGKTLGIKKAVGHMVSYFYDIDGNIIESENDLVTRISLDSLKKADVVLGICHCNINISTLLGALRTGIITHIFVDERIALETIKY
jgi:deoxyribonucleoside regulator